MAEAEFAIQFVIGNEKGFVDNPKDSGGATNFGISLRTLREIPEERLRKYGFFRFPLAVDDVKEMTLEQAKLIYKGEFWDAAPFEKFYNQSICNYVFDMCVLHGISTGIKLLQRALWAVSDTVNVPRDDGVLGDATLVAVGKSICGLRFSLPAERAGFCRLIAAECNHDEEFLNGWLNRCYRI